MKLILGNTRQTHRDPVVAVAGVDNEGRIEEAHAPRAVSTAVMGRPVVAAAAHIANRSPVAVARSRQEDRTVLLQGAPLLSGYCIAIVAGSWAVGVAQVVNAGAPVIRQ